MTYQPAADPLSLIDVRRRRSLEAFDKSMRQLKKSWRDWREQRRQFARDRARMASEIRAGTRPPDPKPGIDTSRW
jgi:hypothetical protein